jgi:hypothetical protein
MKFMIHVLSSKDESDWHHLPLTAAAAHRRRIIAEARRVALEAHFSACMIQDGTGNELAFVGFESSADDVLETEDCPVEDMLDQAAGCSYIADVWPILNRARQHLFAKWGADKTGRHKGLWIRLLNRIHETELEIFEHINPQHDERVKDLIVIDDDEEDDQAGEEWKRPRRL